MQECVATYKNVLRQRIDKPPKRYGHRMAIALVLTTFVHLLGIASAIGAYSDTIAYEVTVSPDLGGSRLEQLWADYSLAQRRPRNIFRRRNNYMITVSETIAQRMRSDIRIIRVEPLSSRKLATRSNDGAISLVDPVLARLCTIATSNSSRSSGDTNCPSEEEIAKEAKITLVVSTYMLYDASASFAAAKDVVMAIQEQLRPQQNSTTTSCRIKMDFVLSTSHRTFQVEVSESQACLATERLLSTRGVVAVEKRSTIRHLNNYGAATGQSGVGSYVDRKNAVIWREGILGQGEVVAVGDSGLDIDSCFFREGKQNAPLLSGCDMTRSKVVCYYKTSVSVNGDDSAASGGGHGTHVAGTIAGLHTHALASNAYADVSFEGLIADGKTYPNGMAPLARLAIMDIDAGEPESLQPPIDLATDGFLTDVSAAMHSLASR
jgi:Subtilase family